MKKIIVLLLLVSALFVGCENKKEEEKKEKEPEKVNKEITAGSMTCTITQTLDNGSNVKTTVYADFENSTITKASSKSVYSDKDELKNACDGVEIANTYNEKKIDYSCTNNTLTFKNYFDQSEKSEYSRDEFRASLINVGYKCEIIEK